MGLRRLRALCYNPPPQAITRYLEEQARPAEASSALPRQSKAQGAAEMTAFLSRG